MSSNREGEGEDSVKFTVEVDVNDPGPSATPKDIQKLVAKEVKAALAKERKSVPRPVNHDKSRLKWATKEANRMETQRQKDADYITRLVTEHNREMSKNEKGVIREYEKNLKEKILSLIHI